MRVGHDSDSSLHLFKDFKEVMADYGGYQEFYDLGHVSYKEMADTIGDRQCMISGWLYRVSEPDRPEKQWEFFYGGKMSRIQALQEALCGAPITLVAWLSGTDLNMVQYDYYKRKRAKS